MDYIVNGKKLFQSGISAKQKIIVAERSIKELEKQIQNINRSADKPSSNKPTDKVEKFQKKIEEKHQVIQECKAEIQRTLHELKRIGAKVKKDHKMYAKAFRDTQNAAQQISSPDSRNAKREMIGAKNSAFKRAKELLDIQNLLLGFISKLTDNEFTNAKNFNLGSGLAKQMSGFGTIIEKVRAPGAGDFKNADHLNYEFRLLDRKKPLQNMHIPIYSKGNNLALDYVSIGDKIKPTRSLKDIGKIKITSPLENIVAKNSTKKSIFDLIIPFSKKYSASVPEKPAGFFEKLYYSNKIKPTVPIYKRYHNPVEAMTKYNPLKGAEYVVKGMKAVGSTISKVTKYTIDSLFSKYLKK